VDWSRSIIPVNKMPLDVERTAGEGSSDPHKLTHINALKKWSPHTERARARLTRPVTQWG